MRVVRPYGYPARFNTPRASRHQLGERRWLPLHKLWRPLEVVLLMPTFGSDLIATFNRIPIGKKPFVISFESHLPRLFSHEESVAFRFFTRRLASDQCRAIVPISSFARRTFLRQHRNSRELPILERKLSDVIYPSLSVPPLARGPDRTGEPLRAIFVGSHFARKGGAAVLLAAEKAHRVGANIEFHIVSDLTIGQRNGVWTDPSDPGYLKDELTLLRLPNVVQHGKLPNGELLKLLQSCHVGLLPTLSDTFGYSVLEFFAAGVPVLATRSGALPELITPGKDGILIDIPVDEAGEWLHLFKHDNDSDAYREILKDTYGEMSTSILNALMPLEADRATLAEMSSGAYATALERFESKRQGDVLDRLYDTVMSR